MKKVFLFIVTFILITSLTVFIIKAFDKTPEQGSSSETTTSNLTLNSSEITSSEAASSNNYRLQSPSKEIASKTTSDNISSKSTSSKPFSDNVSSKKTSSKSSSKAESMTSSSSKTNADEINLSNNNLPLPPVSEELQQLYLKGLEMYKWFYSDAMYSDNCQIAKDGTRVPDSRFTNYESFYNYLSSIFSNCYIEERLLNDNYHNSDQEMSDNVKKNLERIKNYEEHSFFIYSESENRIEVRALVNFNENGKRFQVSYPLIFEKEEDYWTISDFYLWYIPYYVKNECIMLL